MDELRLYLFGLPRIEFQGRLIKIDRRKALALAAYLALSDRRQSRDTVANLFWPDLDRDHGRSALRSTLRALTTPVPFEWIEADRSTLALKQNVSWVDVHEFSALLSESEPHGHDADRLCEQCVPLYLRALELYQADFMNGFSLPDSVDYDDWQISQREWLRREFADIQRRLSVYYTNIQHYPQAIKFAQQWLAVDPFQEPAQRHLMRLYAANGQRSEALRQYSAAVELLEAELATTPEEETTQLYETILNGHMTFVQNPPASVSPASASSVLPPLPSLVIGRDETFREIKRRLGVGSSEIHPITVIQGWPGVGKSTTVAMLAHDQEVAQQFPDGILWTSLGENPGILSDDACLGRCT